MNNKNGFRRQNKRPSGSSRPITKEQAILREKQRAELMRRRNERKAVTDKAVALLVFASIGAAIILIAIFAYIFISFRGVDKVPDEPVKITVSEDETVVLDNDYYAYKNGKYFVSLTKLSEICGFTLHGNPEEMTFSASDTNHATFEIGTRGVKINGTYSILDDASYFSGGNLFIPVSFFENYCSSVKCEFDKKGKVKGYNLIFAKNFRFSSRNAVENSAIMYTGDSEHSSDSSSHFKSDLSDYEMYMNPENKDDFLLLVNNENRLSAKYVPEDLVEVSASKKGLESEKIRLYPAMALEAMIIEMRANGFDDIFVTCGYTSYDYQKQVFDNKVKALREEFGDKAEEEAKKTVSAAGASEHQSGLCVDMHNMPYESEEFATENAYKWLYSNCAEFGFILRYPKDKTRITSNTFEPWHFRYVGRYHAKKIMDSGLCLEEYLLTL